MSQSDALNLPEVIHTVIEVAKCHNFGRKGKYGYDEALFRSFVLRISLVSQTWSQATRPFLFHSVKLSFGAQSSSDAHRHSAVSAIMTTIRQAALNVFQNKRRTSLPPVLQRMEDLLGLVQSNPRISGYIKHLELDYAPGLSSAAEFSQCAATLVYLYDGLHTLNSLHISWNLASDSLRRGEPWWMGRLDEVGRKTFQHLIESRPSLRTLYIWGAALPLSMWSVTSITKATMYYASHGVPSNSIALSSRSRSLQGTPEPRTTHRRGYTSLVDLTIADDSSRINDVWATIAYSRNTLRRLMCRVDVDFDTAPPPVGSITHNSFSGTRDKLFVLTDFHALRQCSLTFTVNKLPPSDISDWAIQVVESLPWRAMLATLEFRMVLISCPTLAAGLAHTPFDPISMFKKLDNLIADHVSNRLRAGGPLVFGTVFHLEIQSPCTACNESGCIPPPSSPIWNPVTLFPRLNQHNQEGWLGLWVNFKYWDSEKQERAYFPEYISEPYEILKLRRRQLLLAGRQSR